MNIVQNNASAIILLSIREYESIMNSQSGTKDCIMKESKIIGFKFDEKNNLDCKIFQRLAFVHHYNFAEPPGLLHDFFSSTQGLLSLNIILYKKTRESKGYCFLEFVIHARA